MHGETCMLDAGRYYHRKKLHASCSLCAVRFAAVMRRHALVLIPSSDLAPGTYGGKAILVLYGGTRDVSATNGSLLMNDLWVFRFADNTWCVHAAPYRRVSSRRCVVAWRGSARACAAPPSCSAALHDCMHHRRLSCLGPTRLTSADTAMQCSARQGCAWWCSPPSSPVPQRGVLWPAGRKSPPRAKARRPCTAMRWRWRIHWCVAVMRKPLPSHVHACRRAMDATLLAGCARQRRMATFIHCSVLVAATQHCS